MRFLYALALLAFVAAPASAQLQPEQPGLANVGLRVSGQPDLNVLFTNLIGPADVPPIYTVPDTSASFLITYSAFQRIVGTDTTSGGTPIVGAGVTAEAVVALTAAGEFARGCVSADVGAPTDIVNQADFAGKFVIISRGDCGFFLKTKQAEAAGAVAVLIVNNLIRPVRPNDNITTLLGGGPVEGETNAGIIAGFVPSGIGLPIVEELIFGTATITLQLFDTRTVAAENGPATTESGLTLQGANPFSTSTELRLFSENAEAVRVEMFNVRGQLISTLFQGTVSGERAVTVSSADVAPGVYFVRATGETFRKQIQLTVIR